MGPLRSWSTSLSLSSFGDDVREKEITCEYGHDKWLLFTDGLDTLERTLAMIFREKSLIEREKKIDWHCMFCSRQLMVFAEP